MFKVAIDAGHGDLKYTPGKRTPDNYAEHWINVKCANYFDIAMKRCGIKTLKVAWNDTNGTDDIDVPLTTRQKQVKNAKCDISVSFHANAAGDGKTYNNARGVETLIHSNVIKAKDSKALADKVQNQLIKGTPQSNRGIKKQSLAICNCLAMGTKASILIEIGFMTNKEEAELMKHEAFCKECAEETAIGVCEYLGVNYVKEGSGATPTPTPAPTKPTITSKTPTKIPSDVKSIQNFLNTYYGDNIKKVMGKLLVIDGSFGKLSKKAIVIAFQTELNKLGAGLVIDGVFGRASTTEFNRYVGTLVRGSKGIFVTLWQCLLVGLKFNPNGIDGVFGSGCVKATNSFLYSVNMIQDSSVSGEDLRSIFK